MKCPSSKSLPNIAGTIAHTQVVAMSGASESADAIEAASASSSPEVKTEPPQQIYIIQTEDGSMAVDSGDVVVADDVAVYETVSALEQLSRGHVITDSGELLQVNTE